jgi:hypothetical protein
MASPAWTSDEIWSKPTYFCLVVCLYDANAKKNPVIPDQAIIISQVVGAAGTGELP